MWFVRAGQGMVQHMGHGVVRSNRIGGVPFREFVARLPRGLPERPESRAQEDSRPNRNRGEVHAQRRYPDWAKRGAPILPVQQEDSDVSSHSDHGENEDEHLANIVRRAGDLRDEWREAPEDRLPDFVTDILAWGDFHIGQARGGDAPAWCRLRGLRVSYRASILKYGSPWCAVLCRAWCSKMQHFFDIARVRPRPEAYVFPTLRRRVGTSQLILFALPTRCFGQASLQIVCGSSADCFRCNGGWKNQQPRYKIGKHYQRL